jgi:hypothetical protein
VKPLPLLKRRPFVEFRRKEIGLGFSLALDHDGERWQPNVWIHVGPFVAGIELHWGPQL